MSALAPEIAAARRFTRFFTREAELLDEAFLDSRFSLTEGRVLYELCSGEETTASELAGRLGLDRGYLSRLLRSFEADGLLTRQDCPEDGRRQIIAPTPAGRAALAPLDRLSQVQWQERLGRLDRDGRARLVAAMEAIEAALRGREEKKATVTLRPHRSGDLGWVAHRQGLLYAQEYGWDDTYEALVAEILAAYVRSHDPARERGWIAERGGDILGSVYCVRQSDEVAKLRLLYVEPAARGSGLGARLVDECIGFARVCGYRRLVLWTNDCLVAARQIYVKAGFTLVEEERHRSFGNDLVGQNWQLLL